jgi:hypothetical protein
MNEMKSGDGAIAVHLKVPAGQVLNYDWDWDWDWGASLLLCRGGDVLYRQN